MKWLLFIAALFPFLAHSGSIYLCKAYSGGTFWAQSHCSKHSALIDSIVSVPDSLAFDQQVNLAEQQRRSTAIMNTVTHTTVTTSPAQDRNAECKTLDARITDYDAQARHPQSGQMQDWISENKRKARDRQFSLRC
ncbi:hypothetical protein [Polaromonas glacialis]|uniref:hypothetical protein n=1 Tax=Polaromonas glacialis TaxID=866564 RepID=UPI0012EC0EDF|nr:hypothetical protein [Polaromonas glacialis]